MDDVTIVFQKPARQKLYQSMGDTLCYGRIRGSAIIAARMDYAIPLPVTDSTFGEAKRNRLLEHLLLLI